MSVGEFFRVLPPTDKDAPVFGRRLSEARREKGLTQRELADKLNTTWKMIDYYERRAINPALEVVQACAKAFEILASQLIAEDEPQPKKKSGPTSQLERKFQEIKKLPRKKQEFILQFVHTILESNQTKQKA